MKLKRIGRSVLVASYLLTTILPYNVTAEISTDQISQTWTVNYVASEGGTVTGELAETVTNLSTPLANIEIIPEEGYEASYFMNNEGNTFADINAVRATPIDNNETYTVVFDVQEVEAQPSENNTDATPETQVTQSITPRATETCASIFPDPALAQAVAAALSKSVNDPVTQAELDSITSFTATSKGIVSIVGLNRLTGITYLNLNDNQIEDLGVITYESFTKLVTLNFESNHIRRIDNVDWADMPSLLQAYMRFQTVELPVVAYSPTLTVPNGIIGAYGTPVSRILYTTPTGGVYNEADGTMTWNLPTQRSEVSFSWQEVAYVGRIENSFSGTATYPIGRGLTFLDWDDSVIHQEAKKVGDAIIAPADPERPGYTFTGWDVTVPATMPDRDLVFVATYEPKTDTQYKVEHYKQQIDGSYVLFETETLQGTTDAEVSLTPKNYDGYTHVPGDTNTGIITADGGLVLKAYYDLKTYTVTFKNDNGDVITTSTLKVGEEIIVPTVPPKTGYTFTGWTPAVDATMPANDVIYTATYAINQHTATFNNYDGTKIESNVLDFGANITAPADPERAGYTFTGWTPAVDATMPDKDVTYTAEYTANTNTQYKVEHYQEQLDGSFTLVDTELLQGTTDTTVDATINTYEGFTFSADNVNNKTTGTIEGDGSLTLKVHYVRNVYNLLFRDYNNATILSVDLKYGAPIIVPDDPERFGYDFTGWIPTVAETMPNNDLVYVATYEVTLDVPYTTEYYLEQQDGSYVMTESVKWQGPLNTTVNARIKTYAGYTFDPTNPNDAHSGPIVEDGSLVLKVYYTLNTYKVTFNKHDGTPITSEDLKFGAQITAPTAPERPGYTYTGWTPAVAETMPANDVTYTATYTANTDTPYKVEHYFEKANGTYELRETENLTGTTDTTVNATIKTTAGYTQDPSHATSKTTGTVAADGSLVLKVYYDLNTYTVTFNDRNDGLIISEDLKFGADITAPTAPTVTGYTFTGWTPEVDATMPANDVTYTATYTANTDTQYKVEHYQEQQDGSYTLIETENLQGTSDAGAMLTPKTYDGFTFKPGATNSGIIAADGSLVLKAYYTLNTYTVTFNDRNDGLIISEDLKFGADITAPTAPEVTGYTFTGWTPVVDATMPANNVTYTATYSINQYTVTFNDHDGRQIDSATLDFGADITAPTDPERPGYTFTGWTPAVDATMPASDVTYTATYTANTDTPYKVEHYFEKLNSTYELRETENLTGTTDTTVNATIKTTAGYTQDPSHATSKTTGTVAADGSLVLKVYYDLNTYTVTFNDRNDGLIISEDLKFGADITAPTAPTVTGYTFTGWTPEVDATMPANDVTYTATYTANTDTAYKVEYYVEKLDGTFEVKEFENLTGTTDTTVEATIKTFDGYTQDTTNVNNVTTGTIAADGSLVLKVYYTLNTYTVTFNNHDGSKITSEDLKFGEEITAPADPERTGYTFTGWTPVVDATMPANNVTYTATYSINQYTVTFNDHDGRQIDSATLDFGADITAPTDPERPGYTFTGWTPAVDATMPASDVTYTATYTANTDTPYKVEHYFEKLNSTYELRETENLTGTTDTTVNATIKTTAGYTQDPSHATSKTTGTVAADGSLVLKVYYDLNTYTVTFNDRNDGLIISEDLKFGADITAPTAPTVTGYTFTGWTPEVDATMPANDVTYTATYTANTDTAYKVEYYVEKLDGTFEVKEFENLTGTTDTTVEATIKTFDGYTQDTTNVNNVTTGTIAADGSLVLKVYYTLNTYTVTFNNHDGSKITSEDLKFGEEITAPADPERTGYTFTGWTPVVDATMPANNVTYTATYSINQYTVTFNDHDGREIDSATLDFGADITAPTDPERLGYTFTGWTPAVDATMPASDVTYTATYTANTDTPYKVEHYFEKLNSTYELRETENLTGTTDTTVNATIKTTAGYTQDPSHATSKTTGTVAADGSLVLKVYYDLNTYTVTFNDRNDGLIISEDLKFGADITTPTAPTVAGYTFTGWTPEVDATMPANDVTYTATYTANTDTAYKVEYYVEKLDGTFEVKEFENLTGTTDTTVEATIKTFDGYTQDTANVNNVTTGTIAGDGSLVLKVYYTLNTYTVTFNDHDGSNITSEDLKFGADINKPTDPERAGYTFTGWTPAVDATMPANNVTYTATYTANTDTPYKVEYYLEQLDESFELVETDEFQGTTDEIVEAIIKTFDGYYYDEDNDGKTLDGTVVANGSLVLKVYYKLNTYKATFNDHDGDLINTADLKFGADITAPADPERAGYTFTGWTPEVDATMPANDVTYTAEYTANTDTAYKVEYYVEKLDGTFEVKETENLTGTTDTTVEATIKTFEGYTQDPTNANSKTTGTIAGDGSLVLKVYYTLNTYKVTFNDHDGNEINSEDLKFGADINKPADPERTGYTFTGWTPAVDATMPANDVTYTAEYSINQYTVTFNDHDGALIDTDTLDFGATINKPADPERAGYTFTGWTPAVDATMPANNVTYTAEYTANTNTPYKVEYYREVTSMSTVLGSDSARREVVGSLYDLYETDELVGTTDTVVNATIKTYTGYTVDTTNELATLSGTVAGDGSLVLRVYYKINQYTVTFNDFDGRQIDKKTLDFGADITAPTDPERTGYTFTGWTPTVDATVPANDVTYTATYTANTNTAYKVEYYQEQLDGTYAVGETVNLQGTTDTTVNAEIKTFDGFTYVATNPNNVLQGKVAGDGSLVLKVYYTRNIYNVVFRDYDNKTLKTADLKFGAPIVAPADPKRFGFDFAGWAPTLLETMPAKNMVFSALYEVTTDLPYTTEYYQEQLDGSYIVAETDVWQGPLLETVRADIRDFAGFTYDETNINNSLAGPVLQDGSLVLKVYYKRNMVTAIFEDYDNTMLLTETKLFGEEIEAPIPTRPGYVFLGWTPAFGGTMPAVDTTYVALYRPLTPENPVTPTTDDGGPFTVDECGTITDRWGNVMYKNSVCTAPNGYVVPNTGLK